MGLCQDGQGRVDSRDRSEQDGDLRRELPLDTGKRCRERIGSMNGESVAQGTRSYLLIWHEELDTDDDGAHSTAELGLSLN